MDIKYGEPVFMRCKHSKDNQPTLCHSKVSQYKANVYSFANNDEFKVGLVLHFGWRKSQDEDWLHRIDIDLTCPKVRRCYLFMGMLLRDQLITIFLQLPTRNKCDGQIGKIQQFLLKTKPIGKTGFQTPLT